MRLAPPLLSHTSLVFSSEVDLEPMALVNTVRRVAVIGAGPSGLAAVK